MKRFLICSLSLFILSPVFAQQKINTMSAPPKLEKGRYQIYMAQDGDAIMLDNMTGTAWRRVYCPARKEENNVIGCWESMSFNDFITPSFIRNGVKK